MDLLTKTRAQSVSLSFAGLCFLNIVASLDATALSTSLSSISLALNANTLQIYWGGTGFLLSSAVFQPVFVAFSNAFGRRQITLFVLALFVIGTLICGSSNGITQFLVGRVVQGVGAGGMIAMTYTLIADLVPLKDRGKAMSLISVVWLVGTVCGPVLGGGFSASVTWRWIFWATLPFAGIGFVLIAFYLHVTIHRVPLSQALVQVDWLGAILFIISLTSTLVALSWGGVSYPWSSYQTLVPLLVGLAGLVAWIVYEHTMPESPIIPLAILTNRTTGAAYFGLFCSGLIQFALLYYLPLYYQISKGYSPTISGVALLPQCLLSGASSIATGMVIAKTRRYKFLILVGWAVMALGCGILVLLRSRTTVAQLIFLNAVSGIGLGIIIVAIPIAAQAATSDQYMSIAAGLSPFFRAIGQAMGVVISGTIFQNVFRYHLQTGRNPVSREQARGYATDTASLQKLLKDQLLAIGARKKILGDFDTSLHGVWWFIFSISILAGLISCGLREIPLEESSRGQKTQHISETTDVGGVSVISTGETFVHDKVATRNSNDGGLC